MVSEITMSDFERIMSAVDGKYVSTSYFGAIKETKTYRSFDFFNGKNETYLFRDMLDDDFEFNIEKMKIAAIFHDFEKDEDENQISLMFINGDSLIINFCLKNMIKELKKNKKKDPLLKIASSQYVIN